MFMMREAQTREGSDLQPCRVGEVAARYGHIQDINRRVGASRSAAIVRWTMSSTAGTVDTQALKQGKAVT